MRKVFSSSLNGATFNNGRIAQRLVAGCLYHQGQGFDPLSDYQLVYHLSISQFYYMDIEKFHAQFIGLTLGDAIALAKKEELDYRIVKSDGQDFIITMDLRVDRLNFETEKGFINQVYFG